MNMTTGVTLTTRWQRVMNGDHPGELAASSHAQANAVARPRHSFATHLDFICDITVVNRALPALHAGGIKLVPRRISLGTRRKLRFSCPGPYCRPQTIERTFEGGKNNRLELVSYLRKRR
jgi:hypothetical protein